MMLRAVMIGAVLVQMVVTYKYSACGLARNLRILGVTNRDDINKWICIAKHESALNTQAVGKNNPDGSYDHGIFQINDRYWCEHGRPGKGCNIRCEDLINDNIADDLNCALHIRNKQGLQAWVAWNNVCAYGNLPDYSWCSRYWG